MDEKGRHLEKQYELRRRAEEVAEAKETESPSNISALEAHRLIHELQVHQIELELQNEELRHMQAELEAREAQYFDLYDHAPVGYFTISENGLILNANLTGAKLFGMARKDLFKQPFSHFIFPEDQDIYYLHRKQLIASGSSHILEIRFLRDGSNPWWAQMNTTLMRNSDGEVEYRSVLSDVTERKKLQEELNHARNLESLGILAGGIAHDFNNILQSLLGYLSLAMVYTDPKSKAYPLLQSAESAYEIAINLTDQFIAFSTGGTSVKELIQPVQLIQDSVSLSLRDSDINAIFALPSELQSVYVDPRQLSHVVSNIALNAREAMPSGGILLVSASNVTIDNNETAELAPGKYIKISVKDHGQGIDPNILPKIFDPYFSTKPQGSRKGQGLGLTVSNAIVKRYKGAIKVESELGKGTVFHIYLPATSQDVEPENKKDKG